jgi:hypothetical protein
MIEIEPLFSVAHTAGIRNLCSLRFSLLRFSLVCISIVFLSAGFTRDGQVYGQARINVLPESDFRIAGRSNESDFEVHSTVISGWVELSDANDARSVTGLSLVVPAKEIKSDKGLIMNRVMWGGLETDEHPEISFEMISASAPDAASDSVNLVVTGLLTLTGTTNEVVIELLAESDETGSKKYVGSFPLTMTDYDMAPPTAMFGRLRVHKDIEIYFDLKFGPAADD